MLITAESTSLFITVFLPECLANLTASDAISDPLSSKIFANASLASLLVLGAPAFFNILPTGAIGSSKESPKHIFKLFTQSSLFSSKFFDQGTYQSGNRSNNCIQDYCDDCLQYSSDGPQLFCYRAPSNQVQYQDY